MQIPQLSSFIQTIICKLAQRKRANDNESAELSDLSYEDALLDVQMRSYFGDEYRESNPPANVFPRLTHAIRLYEQEQERQTGADPSTRVVGVARRFAMQLGQAMVGLYRAGSNAGTSRMLSGGLVTALLVLAMGPSMMRVLSGVSGSVDEALQIEGASSTSRWARDDGRWTRDDIGKTTSPQQDLLDGLQASQQKDLLERKTGEDFDAPYQMQDVSPLHPVELGLVGKKAGQQHLNAAPEPVYKLNADGPY